MSISDVGGGEEAMTTGPGNADATETVWECREKEILRELGAGVRRNLGCLMDHYGESLMRYLTAIIGDRALAEDIFQDTWIRVMERIGKFDAERRFSPWLYRVARNCAYDRLRRWRWKRRFGLGSRDSERPQPELAAPGDTHNRLIAQDLADTLLTGLEPQLRELVWLRFYREMSYQELADHCEQPIGTIKSRLARAMDQLAKRYQRMEGWSHVRANP